MPKTSNSPDDRRAEREEAMRASAVRRKKRKRRRLLGWFVGFLVVAAGVTAVLCLTVLFPIREIVATGQSRYTADQIVLASGIREGQNLFCAGRDAAERISQALPYIGSVSVRRELSGRLVLTVKDTVAAACYRTPQGYVLTDEAGRILDRPESRPDNVPLYLLAGELQGEPGEDAVFSDPDEQALLEELCDLCRAADLRVTSLDLRDPLDLNLTVDGRFRAYFGTKTDFPDKLTHLKRMLAEIDPDRQGTVDLKTWTSDRPEAYFRDVQIVGTEDDTSSAPAASTPASDASSDSASSADSGTNSSTDSTASTASQ